MPQGVKQGCKISPTLFAIYINDLANDVNALKCGIQLNNSHVLILLDADGIALFAPDEEKLQRILNTVHAWCRKWRLIVK